MHLFHDYYKAESEHGLAYAWARTNENAHYYTPVVTSWANSRAALGNKSTTAQYIASQRYLSMQLVYLPIMIKLYVK